ncbi:MAG: ATP-binding protein [Candidatus Ozemobacteraceae bacterium]
MNSTTLTILNDNAEFDTLPQRVADILCPQGIVQDTIDRIMLALEEMLTNTIKYGYDDKDAHHIEIGLQVEADEILLTIVDGGHPFDPLAAIPPDTDLPIDERPIGGLGIHLVRKMSSSMRYEYKAGQNHLEIRFSK